MSPIPALLPATRARAHRAWQQLVVDLLVGLTRTRSARHRTRGLADAYRAGFAHDETDRLRWLETHPAAAGRLDQLMAEIEAHRHQHTR
jgi:hypothetical protein